MAESNMEGLKRAIGPYALHKMKTCVSHFKECRNRQARKLNEHVDEIVKTCAMPCLKP